MSRSIRAARRPGARALTVTAAVLSLFALPQSAFGAPGYELDSVKPSIATDGEIPRGVAVDQATRALYVTTLMSDQASAAPGQVEQFDANGVPTANSPFSTGGSDYFAGVAVNPVDHSIYAYQVQLVTSIGTIGTATMSTFSSTGTPGVSFTPPKSTAPQLAADASGRVYLPNDSTGTIQVFDSAGSLKESIACAGCPGGGFVEPVSVALDSAGNLYAVDLSSGGRVVKFKPSGGTFAYDSTLQSGRGAAAVGIDPSDDTVFVGALGDAYHVLAYDSSGAQIDDFGEGIFADPPFGAVTAGQIAVDATSRSVYVVDSTLGKVWVFDRVASIPAPAAATAPATATGQLEANLNATVEPRGHGLTACSFRYIDDADYQVNGFANATVLPCPSLPGGTAGVPMSVSLTGLSPATKYDFQVSASSNGGSAQGAVLSFTTLPSLPPTVTTGSASAITQTTATIAGSVNAKGGPISDCRLEYVKQIEFEVNDFAGAATKLCSPQKPNGTSNVSVSTKLTGLSAATEYRFRVVATNNSGTTTGTDHAFSTLADTCATKPELCPPVEEPPAGGPPPSAPAVLPSGLPQPPAPGGSQAHPLRCRKGFKKKRVRGKLRCVKARKHRRGHSARSRAT